ncbi:hypothetical protein ACLE20_05220 [Rhizobium sp. YIM 134829]|uniref:hypothetical protein n=1 Tax=Rhizobium sp. YIM 134829 TaxID=3390453 RepID=UPI00397B793E
MSDDVCTLIEKEQARTAAVAKVQSLINEGLASGISDRSPEQILKMARGGAASRHS